MGYLQYFNTLILSLTITVAVAYQPLACLANITFSTSNIKVFSYCLHYKLDFKVVVHITFKLTVFNNDTLSLVYINFLVDQLSFKVTINFIILMS